jgi:hypothetical protein
MNNFDFLILILLVILISFLPRMKHGFNTDGRDSRSARSVGGSSCALIDRVNRGPLTRLMTGSESRPHHGVTRPTSLRYQCSSVSICG